MGDIYFFFCFLNLYCGHVIFISFNLLLVRKNYAGEIGKTNT